MDKRIVRKMPNLAAELEYFEEYLMQKFTSQGYVQKFAKEVVTNGGKRIRPALVIASAMTGDYCREKVLPMAAAIETMHAATLVHDDVIDDADTRRNRPSLHRIQGNHIAIYAGDYMLARALRMLAECELPLEETSKLAYVIEQICAGDISQYLGKNKVPGYRTYLRRISGKTGLLFAASCASGAYIGQVSEKDQKKLWHFGIRLGASFQIKDDLLDMNEDQSIAGKPTGRDLQDGIVTLPILLSASYADYKVLLENYLAGDKNEVTTKELIKLARAKGSFEKSKQILADNLKKCRNTLDDLPDSEGKKYLYEFVNIVEE